MCERTVRTGLPEGSKQRLAELVEQLLANKDVNFKLIPDFIERKLYNNVLVLAMALLDEALKNSEVVFLGHKLTFTLSPLPDPSPTVIVATAAAQTAEVLSPPTPATPPEVPRAHVELKHILELPRKEEKGAKKI